ncbi:EF-hand domain-containing protein [Paraburkholderia flava]|uniref:EF-hand domain-containing protein n=1 Tax=Paraburkholderia flava TaxID=2547393 RepID=UPI001061DC83|nr:EF-hand domain-containing protein [Paraburkholderia flava]
MNKVWARVAMVCAVASLASQGAVAQVVTHAAGIAPISASIDAHMVRVGDMLRPPPSPPTNDTPELRGQALHQHVLDQMQQRFDAAADPSTHLLTQQAAKDHGMGFIADHFQQIDRTGSGYISFDDFRHFLKARHGMAFSNN